MGFEAIAPPPRSRIWEESDVTDAAAVLDEHGKVGWNDPYESEGKARGAGSALARMLHELTGDAYRVSVFELSEEKAPNGEGFYFSIKVKVPGDESEAINPEKYKRDELVAMASERGVSVNDGMTKKEIAKAINAAPVEAA